MFIINFFFTIIYLPQISGSKKLSSPGFSFENFGPSTLGENKRGTRNEVSSNSALPLLSRAGDLESDQYSTVISSCQVFIFHLVFFPVSFQVSFTSKYGDKIKQKLRSPQSLFKLRSVGTQGFPFASQVINGQRCNGSCTYYLIRLMTPLNFSNLVSFFA